VCAKTALWSVASRRRLRHWSCMKSCEQCRAPGANKRCGACKAVYYCSVECQKAGWSLHKSTCRKVAPTPPSPVPAPVPARRVHRSREGGSWDDVDERQLLLTLSEDDRPRALYQGGSTSLLSALSAGLQSGTLKAYCNPPRYDRLIVLTTDIESGIPGGSATYTIEAGLDNWEGLGWWETKAFQEEGLVAAGLEWIDAQGLEMEYCGVLAFLEACRRVGPPRYVMKTELDPNAQPHVIAVVERLLASSSLAFVLTDEARERTRVRP
jgi:hypothetical protein